MHMVWRRYPYNSIWSEMEDMRAEWTLCSSWDLTGADSFRPGVLLTECCRRYKENFVLMFGNMMMK